MDTMTTGGSFNGNGQNLDGSAPPPWPHRLTPLDAAFLYLERPRQFLHIAALLTFDGVLEYERLITDVQSRLHLIPRYRQRIMSVPFEVDYPTWEPDPTFDVRAHVRRHLLPAPGSDAELTRLASSIYARPLDRERPLWEMHLIDGYRGNAASAPSSSIPEVVHPSFSLQPDAPPRSVLLVKVHHCMADGVGGIDLLRLLLDPVSRNDEISGPPEASAPLGPSHIPALPGVVSRFVNGFTDAMSSRLRRQVASLAWLAHPANARRDLRATADAVAHVTRSFLLEHPPRTPFNGRCGPARALGWVTASLPELRAIKEVLGGSLNDIVLALVSGALRRLLERDGSADRVELRALVPVNARTAGERHSSGNHLSLMIVPLPVGIVDPIERWRQVHAATAQLKASNAPEKMERVMTLLGTLPPVAQHLLRWLQDRVTPINTICTNVPGPPVPLYLQGVRLERVLPFVPLVEGLGVAFAVVSYTDTLSIGITADPELVPEPHAVEDALRASIDDLVHATAPLRWNAAHIPHGEGLRHAGTIRGARSPWMALEIRRTPQADPWASSAANGFPTG